MAKSNALIPVDQKNVDFYGDKVMAVRLENGRIFVPVRPLVEALGLSWSSQLQRIRRDPVLKTELFSVFVTNTESQRGGLAYNFGNAAHVNMSHTKAVSVNGDFILETV